MVNGAQKSRPQSIALSWENPCAEEKQKPPNHQELDIWEQKRRHRSVAVPVGAVSFYTRPTLAMARKRRTTSSKGVEVGIISLMSMSVAWYR